MQKCCDFWRDGGETDGKTRAIIRWCPHDLPVDISRDLFAIKAYELHLDIAQWGD